MKTKTISRTIDTTRIYSLKEVKRLVLGWTKDDKAKGKSNGSNTLTQEKNQMSR